MPLEKVTIEEPEAPAIEVALYDRTKGGEVAGVGDAAAVAIVTAPVYPAGDTVIV